MSENLKKIDYYLGLDCGTDSVGFAVTDLNYNILKFNGKSMWGSHIFDQASTAAERRVNRCARRRLQRRKQRIALLQSLFAEEIYKVDPTFFIRLNDSSYVLEDKKGDTRNIVFNDLSFKDKDYFKKYPTVYHLRHALMNENIHDPRLLYLGIAHILKHRGHFLFPGENIAALTSILPLMNTLNSTIQDVFEIEVGFSSQKDFEQSMQIKKSSERSAALENVLDIENDKLKKMICKCLSGYKVTTSQLFMNDAYADLCAIEFKKLSFEEEDMPVLEETLSDDEYKLVVAMKALFDWSLLEAVRNGQAFISDAKIEMFEKNKDDLRILKHVVSIYASDSYDSFFHGNGVGSFVSYIGKNHDDRKGGKNEYRMRRCKIDDFYGSVKKLLKDADAQDKDIIYINNEIEKSTFLPMLSSYRNSVIPYQLNKLELDTILKKAVANFPFLSRVDEDGLTVAQKIVSILTYRIPYYVGPLNIQNASDKNWIVRRENGRIYPWNIEKKVDFDKSAEAFILRMTNKCTYCKEEDVLPKHSLSYQNYMVLNELNNVCINGSRLSVERKQIIYNSLFKNNKKVTVHKMLEFMVKQGWYAKGELDKDSVTGIDEDFKASLSSRYDFKKYLDSGKLKADDVDLIIKWITLFSSGGSILKNRIKERFKDVLSEKEIEEISKFKYSGWGRFSHKFLYELYAVNKETGELLSIIRMLWETQHNLMELLSNDYEFIDQVDHPAIIGKLQYSVVDDLYVSPAVKRQIWQTLRIVDEIKNVMGHNPKKVFIEVTRSEQEKKRTESRKNDVIGKLKEARKSETGFDIEFNKLIDSLEGYDDSQISRQDKLYLYFSQCGCCMYTGKPIELNELYNTNVYDIDHIYPYSRSNDDSLQNNRVLVFKDANIRKSNDFPIDGTIQKRMGAFWGMLKRKNLISKEKYNRLVRTTPLTDEDLKGFIARQLVETNQSVKASASILKSFFGDETKIVYSKAANVSAFRKREGHEFYKCRSLNHLHHAKDAYLNVVVGNVFDTKYTANFYKQANGIGYGNLSKIYDYDINNAWVAGEEGTINTVTHFMNRNDILFTREPVTKKGALFDLQIVAAGTKKGVLPIKSSNEILKERMAKAEDVLEVVDSWTAKYGGYNSMTTSHFALVKCCEKKKTFVVFVSVSIVDVKRLSTDEGLLKYCTDVLKLEHPEIIRKKVLINTELEIDGLRFAITGKASGGRQITLNSNVPLLLTEKATEVLKHVESFLKKKSLYKNMTFDSDKDKLSDADFDLLYSELVQKCGASIYQNRPGSQKDILENGYEKFIYLNPEDKCKVIAELMMYYGMVGSGKADMSLIGGTKDCGRLTKGARLDLAKTKIRIIDKSITGLFEQVSDIGI